MLEWWNQEIWDRWWCLAFTGGKEGKTSTGRPRHRCVLKNYCQALTRYSPYDSPASAFGKMWGKNKWSWHSLQSRARSCSLNGNVPVTAVVATCRYVLPSAVCHTVLMVKLRSSEYDAVCVGGQALTFECLHFEGRNASKLTVAAAPCRT